LQAGVLRQQFFGAINQADDSSDRFVGFAGEEAFSQSSQRTRRSPGVVELIPALQAANPFENVSGK
jgi:hypothetical protein